MSVAMDFDLSDDQLALRDGADELLRGLSSPAQVRAFSETDALYDQTLWAAMVEQGWLGLAFTEADGGHGLGIVELAVLLESLGARAAPAPFTNTVLAARSCERAGKSGALSALLSGDVIGCVAWSKRLDAVTAIETPNGWQLSGNADPTAYSPAANVAIVPALVAAPGDTALGDTAPGDTAPGATAPGATAPTNAHGITQALFAVSLDDVGRPEREPAMELTRPLGWLRFERTEAQYLGDATHVQALLDDGAVFAACEMLGGAQTVLDMTVAYAKDRVQFGRPIGSFQAVKHRCADMLVDVEGIRSTAYWAAWSINAHDPDTSIAASTAKCWASDASKRVMASGLQVHGGIGFTWEHDLHFWLKRAQLDQLTFGNAAYHRDRIAALLAPRVASGLSVV